MAQALAVQEAQGVWQIPDSLLDWLSSDVDGTQAVVMTGEDLFQQFADQWHKETMFTSATDEIVSHESYRRVIAMGKPAIPWILRDLKTRGGDWFAALEAITGEAPVADDDIGFPRRMTAAWLDWGKAHGYEA